MYSGMFDGAIALFKIMAWSLVLAIPLAIWKFVEIVIWLFDHVRLVS